MPIWNFYKPYMSCMWPFLRPARFGMSRPPCCFPQPDMSDRQGIRTGN